jgi:glycosyltransferase involved in cell wall biosynthesis
MFLSVVAPCFNEAGNLAEFYRCVSAVCAGLGSWEIVLVNDRSTDASLDVIQDLVRRDPHVVGINLARNYGHQIALTAGLRHCAGEHILVLDADLRDPPELLDEMLRLMDENGADVVYGQRRIRVGETWFKTRTAALFYRLMRRLVVFEHNPWNPVTRYVVAHTPIDHDAVLLPPAEVTSFLRAGGWRDIRTSHLMFLPPRLGPVATAAERLLSWLPLGGQYAVTASK